MAVSSCRGRSSCCCVLDHTRRGRDPNRDPTAIRPGPEPPRARREPRRNPRGGTLARVSTDPKDRWLDLGSFIREQRGSARLSLRRLSELAGISNPYLSQIERGLRRPSAEILQQIAKALRISAETLYVQAGHPRAPVGLARPDPGRSWPTRRSARSRSRRSCASTSPSGASTRTSAATGPGRAGPGTAAARPDRRRRARRLARRRRPPEPTAQPRRPGRSGYSRPPVGSDRHAPARRPLSPHLAPGPARHG